MAVHRLFPGTAAATAPTTPVSTTTTAVRRSARLGSHCIVDSRKRVRVSDSEQQSPNLPPTPEPTPRWIRAQRRQKILDSSSVVAPSINIGKTRAGKRKVVIPDDEQHPCESESHHRAIKKKRKENIVNDALAASPSTSSLKISVNLNTRQGGGTNRYRDEKNVDQSQPLKYTRSTRSSVLKYTPSVDSKPKSRPKSKSANGLDKHSVVGEVPTELSCDPCSSTASSSRMMTRTMKKQFPNGGTTQVRLNSSPPADTVHTSTPSSTRTHVPTTLTSLSFDTSHSTNVIQLTTATSPTSNSIKNIQPSTTTTPTFSNEALPSSHDAATAYNNAPSSTSTTAFTTISSSSQAAETTAPLTVSSIDMSISTTPLSISSSPMSYMNVPLSNPIPLPMPLNLAFLNMPLSMSLSMPLNMPSPTDMSTAVPPSESELGFGFQPQEEFSSTGQEEDKGSGVERYSTSGATTAVSLSGISLSSRAPDRSSSPLHPPLLLPPQSCTPGLNPAPTIPPRLVISACVPLQSQTMSISPTSTSPTYSPSYVNPTSPTYPSPLKVVCFPSLPVPQQEPLLSEFQGQQEPSPPASHQLPTLSALSSSAARKEWDSMAMDMAEDQRQSQEALERDMGIGLSIPVLSFGNSNPGPGNEFSLSQQQEQRELEQEQDHSPLLGPAPQPPSPQSHIPYPQLTPSPPPSLSSYSPSPTPCSSSSCASSSSSRQYHKKVEYPSHQMAEWIPKLDRERSLWKVACKIRVWEITKRYAPDTIRTVVAQEAHGYYSRHGFPLGYGSVPVRGMKRRRRKMVGRAGAGSSGLTSDSASSCSSTMIATPLLSPSRHRDDEFMSEETYPFELMDDDDDMDGLVGGVSGGVGVGLRSMEDEWRYEGFEDEDEFGFEDYDDDDDDDIYDDEDEDDDEEVEGDQTIVSSKGMKKGVLSFTTGEDQDQDADAEGEMEVDIEPFQDPLFDAELSSSTSPTSPTGSPTSSKSKSRSKSNVALGNEQQVFESSFYIPPVPPHLQIQQRQEEQQQLGEEVSALAPSLLDLSTNPLPPSSLDGTPISDTTDHTAVANDHTAPMQIHLPPASHHHYPHQLIQLSSNILPLPPPRLDSVRVFVLRQSEMSGLKTTGRGTPIDRKRGAIWGWGGIDNGGGGIRAGKCGGKRGLDDSQESGSESESDGESEGGKRGRPRLKLMLSDHDIESEPRRGRGRHREGGNGAKATLRLSLPSDSDDADVRMSVVPTGFKCDIPESNSDEDLSSNHRTTHKLSSSSSSFVATEQTWDAFLASLDDKNQSQQQGEEGTLDSSVTADSHTTTHGQLLLDLDDHLLNRHRHGRHQLQIESEGDSLGVTRRLGPPSPTLEGSGGMFMFDHECDSSSTWFGGGGDGVSEVGSDRSGVGISVGGLIGSSGTCPSDALALEGFNFPVGPEGSSTLSYALG